MSLSKPRKRLVYFRVSEEEFLLFSAMGQATGARSLSALARTAMQRMLTTPGSEALLAERIRAFDELTSTLMERLRCLNELLEANARAGSIRESYAPADTSLLEQTNA
jgi:hypothetical protein